MDDTAATVKEAPNEYQKGGLASEAASERRRRDVTEAEVEGEEDTEGMTDPKRLM